MKFIFLALLINVPALAENPQKAQTVKVSNKRINLSEAEKKIMLKVLNMNDDLFNAFLKKETSRIEKLSLELHKTVSSAEATILKDLKKNSNKLLNIKVAKPNQENLKEYELFLNPLIQLVKTYDVGDKFNVFYCPMVEKSWLQNVSVNKNVRNVFAMEMLECGSQETHF